MSKNSDFFNSSPKHPKLPQYLKKMLALNGGTRAIRKLFVEAHLAHVAHKLKRGNEPDATTEAE